MRLSAPREVFASLFESMGVVGGRSGAALVLHATRDGVRMVGMDNANVMMATGEVPRASFSSFDLPTPSMSNGGQSVAVDPCKLAGFLRGGPTGNGSARAEWSLDYLPEIAKDCISISTELHGDNGGGRPGQLAFECAPAEIRGKTPTVSPLDLPEPVVFGPEEWDLFRRAVKSAAEVSDFVALEVGARGLGVLAAGESDRSAVEIPTPLPPGWEPGTRSTYTLPTYLLEIVKQVGKLRPESVALAFRADYPLRMEARTAWGGRFAFVLAPRVEDPDRPRRSSAAAVASAVAPGPKPPNTSTPGPMEGGVYREPTPAATSSKKTRKRSKKDSCSARRSCGWGGQSRPKRGAGWAAYYKAEREAYRNYQEEKARAWAAYQAAEKAAWQARKSAFRGVQ